VAIPGPRLAWRIYLAGLAQMAAVILGFVTIFHLRHAQDHEAMRAGRASVDAVVARLGDDAAVAGELARIERDEGGTVVVVDEHGRVLASNQREGEPRLIPPPPPPHGGPPRSPPGVGTMGPPDGPPVPAVILPVRLANGRPGNALYARRNPNGPSRDALVIGALVLVVVGVASLLTARSFARPLGQLSVAARDFGAGKLDARAGIARADEIGDVAIAFDEMAARITALLHAEKELLANVSHELRTPLARIRVALDLAAEGDADTARVALAEIGEDLAELERLIGDVLMAARLDLGDREGGSPPLRREAVDVAELVDRAAARFRAAHPGRPLEVTADGPLPSISADPMLLRRVLDNLLENADRYAKGATDGVALDARAGEDAIVVEVRDHGIGIAEDDLPHVFRPFFRADRSRARATGGLGLGLALSRRIVEAHGGAIELASVLGEGTTARLRLPVPANGAASHSHTPPS
jgi:signal transduction histidine kinase